MSRSHSNRLESCAGETAAERDDHLAEVCSVFALISRGVVSGGDVTRLFACLATLMDVSVKMIPGIARDDMQLPSEDLHITPKKLLIPIGTSCSLSFTARGDGFSYKMIEIAKLLALPLSTCLASPMAAEALRADPGESFRDALRRLVAYAKLNLQGEVLEWSAAAMLLMRNKQHGNGLEEIELALLSAVQAFLRGERVVHRIAPDLVATFAFATEHLEEFLIAGFYQQSDGGIRAMDLPAAALLTLTEMRIASLLVTGQSETVIAEQLGVSRETIRTHRKRIYQKVGVESRAGLVLLFTPAS